MGQQGCPPELWGSRMFPFTLELCMEVNGVQHTHPATMGSVPCHSGLSTWDAEPHALPTQWPRGFPCDGANPATSSHHPGGFQPWLGLADLDEAPLWLVIPVHWGPQQCLALGHLWPHAWDCNRPSPGPERVLGQGTNPGGQALLLPCQAQCWALHPAGDSIVAISGVTVRLSLCLPHHGTPGLASMLPWGRRWGA